MFQKVITKEEIENLPLLEFEGNIEIIEKDNDVERAVSILKQSKIIGFDTETKPNFVKKLSNKVALLQLSTLENAFIFRLHYLKKFDLLFSLLSDPKIMKIGVAISGDFKELQQLKRFKPSNFIDLQSYVKNFEIENISLKKMAAIVLGRKISKKQQRSNWAAEELSDAQIIYAATDAWVTLLIYEELKKNIK